LVVMAHDGGFQRSVESFDQSVGSGMVSSRSRQFESQLFHSLAKLCGIQLSRTTAYHPAANGLVERFHRTLKSAIMCHDNQQWTEVLPLVLLGIRTSFKEDLQASVAELVYGEPLRVPGEFLTASTTTVEHEHLIRQLRRCMEQLRPVPATHHASTTTFVHADLSTCTHVFLRQDASRGTLEPPYSGPYSVQSRNAKNFRLLVRGKTVNVSTERVKPAYVLNESYHDNTTLYPSTSNPSILSPTPSLRPIRSCRHVRFSTLVTP
jgi:hypothetical protein